MHNLETKNTGDLIGLLEILEDEDRTDGCERLHYAMSKADGFVWHTGMMIFTHIILTFVGEIPLSPDRG